MSTTTDTFSTSRFASGTGGSGISGAFSKLSSFGSAGLGRSSASVGSSLAASVLFGGAAEEKIVLDIGSFSLRAGFSGDSAPLHTAELFGKYEPVKPTHRLAGSNHGIYDFPIVDQDLLDALVLEQVKEVYRSHLLLDSKSRKVVVAEGALMPMQLKRALARVLLGNLRVPQITFYPSAVVALMSCGITSGLVVDCGHKQTTVVPVYDGRPLVPYMTSTPLAGEALFESLKSLIKKYGQFVPFDDSVRSAKVTDDILSDEVCRHIQTKVLYVSPLSIPGALSKQPIELSVNEVDPQLVEWFEQSVTGSPTITLTITTKTHGRGTLKFPGWVRERAAEVLLAGDSTEDHKGIVQSIVTCISNLPVDVRRPLASKILMVGGVSDVPHFRIRLLHDLVAKMRSISKWATLADSVALAEDKQQVRESDMVVGSSANGLTFKSSDRCWIGASLAAAAKIGGVELKRDDFDGYSVADWTIGN
ncbi:hypothetical protein FBU59_002011 [Linderina macrospora]|uniref:Uncharacterized protein n=1 Tax=Linderina macrospora TaxID=4868 RepID=A0ACC1JC71_9FUNG|nr:hypothetical protein FBU59_002011 [Linderina macrospora]